MDQEGVFRAQRPGTGTLVLWHGGQSARVPLAVGKGKIAKAEPKLDTPGFVPQAVFSADGATLTVTLANSEGDKLGGEAIALSVTGGVATPNPATTNPHGEAIITIQWDPSTAPSARQVKLSSPGKRFQSVTIKPS